MRQCYLGLKSLFNVNYSRKNSFSTDSFAPLTKILEIEAVVMSKFLAPLMASTRAAQRISAHGGVRAVAAVMTILLLIPFNFVRQEPSSDAASYFSHATTLMFNGDLSYENDLQSQPKHPYGASLWFAAVAYPLSRIDVVQGHPIVSDRAESQGSWTMFGMSFASLLAFAAGFVLLVGSLSRMGVKISRGLLWLLLVGAGLGGFWAHFNILYAHTVEFLSVVLIIAVAAASGATLRAARAASFFAPFAVAFSLAVRPSNVGLLLLPLAIVLLQRARGRPVTRSFRFGLAGWLAGRGSAAHRWQHGVLRAAVPDDPRRLRGGSLPRRADHRERPGCFWLLVC